MNKKLYFAAAAMLITLVAGGQTKDETIRRSVTLYNPYKPTLQAAAKHTLLPSADDTSTVRVTFAYDFTPGSFVPEYEVSPIKSAVLSPDPLEEIGRAHV